MKILCQRSTTIGVYQLIEIGNGIFCYGTSEQIKDLRNYLRNNACYGEINIIIQSLFNDVKGCKQNISKVEKSDLLLYNPEYIKEQTELINTYQFFLNYLVKNE